MEHIAALMLLVGCSSDLNSCKEIPVPVPAYETLADCERELPLQVRLSDSGMPKVYGACKEVEPELFEQSASLEWSVTRDGRLGIEIVADDARQIASR